MNATPAAPSSRVARAALDFLPWLLLPVWLMLVAASWTWNLQQAQAMRAQLALETARSFFDQIVLVRRWNARHGGVYVPVTPDTPPNPYLKDPQRDLSVAEGLMLTKINPAYMTRQLSALAEERAGVQFRVTSRRPLRPENAPSPWEDAALQAFERGAAPEIGAFFTDAAGREGYRYIAPLFIEPPCLRCHEEQGYRLGDVRGGISITLPSIAPAPGSTLFITHIAIAVVGGLPLWGLGWSLRRAYRRLQEQALYDPLTGLPNRRALLERLESEWRRARRCNQTLALILCDVDCFKQYNDTFGHQAGDRCLQAVAATLRDNVLRAGDFCARYGGEEFIVVLPNTPLEHALWVAERLRAAVRARAVAHPQAPAGVITLSLGVAATAPPTADYETLIRYADQALYRAKEQGRDRVVCYSPAPLAPLIHPHHPPVPEMPRARVALRS